MRDPHVVALFYTAYSDCHGVEYLETAPSQEWDTERATYRLGNGTLSAFPKGHYDAVEEAKEALRPELEAWEAHVDLMGRPGELRFHFHQAEVVDRNPPPPEDKIVHSSSALAVATATAEAQGTVRRAKYPGPPAFSQVDSDIVRDLLARFRQWQQGREPFFSMAYAVLTRMRSEAGGQKAAARRYFISEKVLGRISELTSTGQGEPLEVRKFCSRQAQPMESGDREWLREAIPAIIMQVANVEAGGKPEMITTNTFDSP